MYIPGGAGAAGSSKAAFAMFQQKDVAAGGTGKVSRYSRKDIMNKFRLIMTL